MKKHLLTILIIFSLLLGILNGSLLHPYQSELGVIKDIFDFGGQVFKKSLMMVVAPLVFVSIVCGTFSLTDIKQMGRIGLKTILLYLITTATAITTALFVSKLIFKFFPVKPMAVPENSPYQATDQSIKDVFLNMIPTNPINSLAEGNMLQIIVFSILLGIAIVLVKDKGKPLIQLFESANEVIMKLIMILIWYAPIGVFCLISKVFMTEGFDKINDVLVYFMAILTVLAIHLIITLPTFLVLFSKLNPIILAKKFFKVLVFAFSTSSSNATIPVTKSTVEKDLGVDNSLASFTIPLGATINMDGTAIMQGVATIFIAQISGIDLSLNQLLTVILMATLASIGTAGVPSAGQVMLIGVLKQVNLPIEPISITMAVDRLLDMSRTSVNVTGDAVVTCIVAKSEGKIDESVYNNTEKDLMENT